MRIYLLLLLAACTPVLPPEGPLPTQSLPERLGACPATSNCVSSRDGEDAEHSVAPLPGGPGDWQRAHAALLARPRTILVAEDAGYRHYTSTTLLWRYVDDVELRQADGVIDVRSASRVGTSDLGVNRRRVEAIRAAMASEDAATAPSPGG